MGEITAPFWVKPFCAVMATHSRDLEMARQLISEHWGPFDLEGEVFDVSAFTDYYQNDMPDVIQKQFFSLRDLQSVEEMNRHAKTWTNDLEKAHLNSQGQRTLNLDPGYLTLDKFVLYTTKNFNHRIYLHDGLFAEITLSYRRKPGGYETHHYTYPDYRTPAALGFFQTMRDRLNQQLQEIGEAT